MSSLGWGVISSGSTEHLRSRNALPTDENRRSGSMDAAGIGSNCREQLRVVSPPLENPILNGVAVDIADESPLGICSGAAVARN